MDKESLRRIDEFLESSLIELFASHGMKLGADSGKGAIDEPIAATIGFTSSNLKGVLVLTICRELAAGTLPSSLRSGVPGDDIIADWTGELSNQMLGRLKNRFHMAGIDIALSTPIVFVGREMRHFSKPSPIRRTLVFAEGRILVEFHADFDKDFEIDAEAKSASALPPEGEILFF